MNSGYGRLSTIVGLVALAALAGCRDQEQGRPLSHDKGNYQGKPDPGLTDEVREVLRQRARQQSY